MKKYIDETIKNIEKRVDDKDIDKAFREDVLIKIDFFNKERIIHLIITLFYALFIVIFLCSASKSVIYLIFGLMLVCFLIPYIIYYFKLEARVQYLYRLYDKIKIYQLSW